MVNTEGSDESPLAPRLPGPLHQRRAPHFRRRSARLGWPSSFGAGTDGCTEIASSRKYGRSREQMRSTLLEVEEAALLLTEALKPSWVREFLDVSPHGPIVDPERLIRALEDLSDRASQARDGPDLATKAGATKPGPGKARPEAMSPRTLCAIMIWEAWKHVHKAAPRPEKPPSGRGRRGLLASRRRRRASFRRRAAGYLAASLQKGRRFERRRTSAPSGVAISSRRSGVGSGGTLLPTRRDEGKRSPLFMRRFFSLPRE